MATQDDSCSTSEEAKTVDESSRAPTTDWRNLSVLIDQERLKALIDQERLKALSDQEQLKALSRDYPALVLVRTSEGSLFRFKSDQVQVKLLKAAEWWEQVKRQLDDNIDQFKGFLLEDAATGQALALGIEGASIWVCIDPCKLPNPPPECNTERL